MIGPIDWSELNGSTKRVRALARAAETVASQQALVRDHTRIEQGMLEHGVILFAEPSPGARLAVKV